jgi:hypothetical protein
MHSFARIAILSVSLFAVADTYAQQPKITNAQVMNKDAGKGLQPELDTLKREPAAVWVGYSIATVPGFHSNWNNGTAYLEDDHKSYRNGDGSESKVSGQGVMLLRVKNGAVEKIRVESPERELDAAGLRFVWLTNVTAEDSVRVLAIIAKQGDGKGLRDTAVFALSQLPKEQATGQLIQLAQTGKDPAVRKQAVFWLGQSNDPKALEYLTQLLQK